MSDFKQRSVSAKRGRESASDECNCPEVAPNTYQKIPACDEVQIKQASYAQYGVRSIRRKLSSLRRTIPANEWEGLVDVLANLEDASDTLVLASKRQLDICISPDGASPFMIEAWCEEAQQSVDEAEMKTKEAYNEVAKLKLVAWADEKKDALLISPLEVASGDASEWQLVTLVYVLKEVACGVLNAAKDVSYVTEKHIKGLRIIRN